MNGEIPANPIPARVVRVYFKEPKDPDKISALLQEPGYEYGGWRNDELGEYLKVIVIGDVPKEDLTKERFSKYGDINKVVCEPEWTEIPRKLTVNPLSAEV